ncbi:cytochrome P450 85A-like [Euphorbia lathyris]|uniref:cytochrome P450 85A-like n=1 Tax=Euphorbia lathyris TaxID=212925 RepID=UPI003313A8EA
MAVILMYAVLLIALLCIFLMKSSNQMRYGRRKGLPAGTMGWPLFGETTNFLRHGPDFMKKRKARYGSLFKTHMLGSRTIISTDPETNRYILMNEGKGLIPGYPKSAVDILGKKNISSVHGSIHKYIRGSFLSLVAPSAIKEHLLPKIDRSLRSFLANWDHFKTLDIQDKTLEMFFFVAFNLVFEGENISVYKAFKSEFDKIFAGAISLPINIPGTKYHSGLQGRKKVIKMLRHMIKERRGCSTGHGDFLDELLGSEETKYSLNDEEIIDQIITILHSGLETVSTTTMMAIKFLHDHPKALQQIRDEHLAIRKRKNPGEAIDWDDYKSMKFTHAVIYETSRLATVVNGLLRKTTQDIELNGYVIPKGWKIYVYIREINYDPLLYPEPLLFNPWRWLDNNLENRNYCFLFGKGSRLCPGKELGIAIISTFLHYFLTQYSWEEVGGDKILKFPRVEAPNGLHIRVSKF